MEPDGYKGFIPNTFKIIRGGWFLTEASSRSTSALSEVWVSICSCLTVRAASVCFDTLDDLVTLLTVWQILFYSWTASEILIAVLTRTRRGSCGKVSDRGSMLILWLVIVSSITACDWISGVNPPNMFGGAHWPRIAGLIVIVCGLAIRWTAVFSLGKAFSANVAIRESQAINTSGVYGLLRHPSYLGLLLVFLAIGLHSRHWLAFGFAVIPNTAALLYRIHVEEEALHLAFGDAYKAYSKRTKRLIPGVL